MEKVISQPYKTFFEPNDRKIEQFVKKSRYRSLVITHLEIAEGFLIKEQTTE